MTDIPNSHDDLLARLDAAANLTVAPEDSRSFFAEVAAALRAQIAEATDWHQVADARSAEIVRLTAELAEARAAAPQPLDPEWVVAQWLTPGDLQGDDPAYFVETAREIKGQGHRILHPGEQVVQRGGLADRTSACVTQAQVRAVLLDAYEATDKSPHNRLDVMAAAVCDLLRREGS